jgi:type II secretory pathway pseudopilin PulG
MTMKNTASATLRKSGAFTLVEVMVALTICTFVVAAAATFFIESLKIYNGDYNRLNVNNDLRTFTLSMETDAAFANAFYIYDTGTNGAPALNAQDVDDYVSPGESGDLVLLVNTSTDNTGTTTVNQVIAYYHPGTTANNDTSPMYRYASPNNLGIAGITPIYALYNNVIKTPLLAMVAANQIYLPTATVIGTAVNNVVAGNGITASAHPNLFYYLWRPGTGNGAFMVLSKIQEQMNNQTVLAIDTYNFTIWPRS